MRTAVIIVVFNTSDFIYRQIELLRRFCTDESFDIIVVDNSTNPLVVDKVREEAQVNGCRYLKTDTKADTSYSHAYAANTAYANFANDYDLIFYCDQDLFPVKQFSIKEITEGKSLSGIAQGKQIGNKFVTYLWPGALMINHSVLGDKKSILDFSPEIGLDTGGRLYKIIESSPADHIGLFDEQPWKNPLFNKSHYDFYTMLYKETFMHFVCGSNWAGKEHHAERMQSLFLILAEKVNPQ